MTLTTAGFDHEIKTRAYSPSALARTDTEIAQALRTALEWDVMVSHERVQSTVGTGLRSLSDEVRSVLDRLHVEQFARNLLGPTGFVNEITVCNYTANPVRVRNTFNQAPQGKAERDADRIAVNVYDGTVCVTGRVHNWVEKQAVLAIAACAIGVCKVEDRMRIVPYV
jgi:osmotically-inducible protein OsmY